jgi:hypothetical protein
MSPQVIYYGESASFWVDPKSAMNYKSADEWPIIEARVDNYLWDFEGYLDESTSYSNGVKNQI